MEIYKLQLKVGQHEFQAEGPVEDVKRDFELWKTLISELPTRSPNDGTTSTDGTTPTNGSRSSESEIPTDALNKIYVKDEKRKLVTLRILPRSEDRNGEAILLLLLGFLVILGADEVPVTSLRPALRQSGCTVDRVDQVAGKHVRSGLLNKGGRGKGGKYGLTNAGTEKAKNLLRTMLSS